MNSAPEAGGAAAALVEGIGETLSHARRALGLSVEDVARQLKFSARQIDALEHGRYGELPGRTIARGMVRGYARLVKLDPAPLLQRMAGAVEAPPEVEQAVSFRKPIPFSDSGRHVNLGYALLSLAVLGVMAAVVLGWPGEQAGVSKLTFVPAGRATDEASAPRVALEMERVPVAVVGAPLAVVVAPAAAAPAAEGGAPSAASSDRNRITLRFGKAAWVEVRGGDGRVLTSQLNAAGTTRVVEGAPPFNLVIGNAQHVQLRYGERTIDLAPHARLDVARLTLE